jgi:hypothetical protein
VGFSKFNFFVNFKKSKIMVNPQVGAKPANLLNYVVENNINLNGNETDWQQSRILGRLVKSNKIILNVPNVPVTRIDVRLCLTNGAKMKVGLSYKGEPTELTDFETDVELFNEKGEFVGTIEELSTIDYNSEGYYWKTLISIHGSKPFATIDSINFNESNTAVCTIIKGEPYTSPKGVTYETFEIV